jgi:hypothetical protein
MKKPNQMVQMDILGPFYLQNSAQKTILPIVKKTVQRKEQVNGLNERGV